LLPPEHHVGGRRAVVCRSNLSGASKQTS
jgi:hypothetical protein